MTNRLLLSVVIFAGILGLAETAEAQYRYRPPAGPVLPSQLNYFRRDVGLTDQYNAFIQPQRQLESQLQLMQQQQQADYQNTQRELAKISEIRESTAGPTGIGGGFMNYLHYYKLPSGGIRSRTR